MSIRGTNALWIGYCGTVLLITCWLAVWWISALSFVLWIGLMSLSAIMCLYGGTYRSRWFFFPAFVAFVVTIGLFFGVVHAR